MLPEDIRIIIFDYHDRYGLIEKRRRLLHQITYGYTLWMRHMCVRGPCFYHMSEYAAKLQLRRHVLYPPYYNHEWQEFLFYFRLARFLAEVYSKDAASPAELNFLLPLGKRQYNGTITPPQGFT